MNMKKLGIIIIAFIFTACATIQGEYMSVRQAPLEPVAGKAMVYFMRYDSEYYNFQIWDGEKLVAIVENKSYTQYIADPGKHTFMAALGADYRFIEADLAPDKTYYIMAARVGFFVIPYFAVIKKDAKWWDKIPRWKERFRNLQPMESELQMGEDSRIGRAKELFKYFEDNKEKFITEKRLTVVVPEDGV